MPKEIHSIKNFIVPYSPGDTQVIIRDISGVLTNEINPWRVTSTYRLPNACFFTVKLQGTDNPINIFFRSEKEALRALTIFQNAVENLKNNTDDIPYDIKIYIDEKIMEVINSSTFVFRQEIPSDTWEIDCHEMDKYPSVSVTDDDYNEIEGLSKWIDKKSLNILFNQEVSGWAFLN